MRRLGIVVALTDAGVIGEDGDLPWRISEDLRHFKRLTMGHAILMGRRTYESIGRPLPGRRNLVISRDRRLWIAGVEVCHSLEEALSRCEGDPMPMVIGGAAIYALALPLATDLFLTEIHRDVQGDTTFPPLERERYRELERRPAETEPDVEFVHLERLEG
ncbi:MAG: dihydrofolate reductase [Myxococcales bacterium]|nr:dihydrofolate reductase [Myxococcales bacterium]